MTAIKALSYVEIDVPFCANVYGDAPCTAAIGVTGDIKCFNSLNTCQDRPNFIDDPVTLRFAVKTGYLPRAIEAIDSIKSISYSPAIVSLGKDLGQRASVSVTFFDHPWPDTAPGYDPYLSERGYDAQERGTYWGKFRARQPFLRGRPFRLIRGELGQALGEMETRHFIIDSFTHSADDGTFTITAKDPLKLADDDRAQAPRVSQGFLVSDIASNATEFTLSPTGIGDLEYGESGYLAIGGKEIVAYGRVQGGGNDADTKLLIHCDTNTFPDSSSSAKTVQLSGAPQLATAIKKFGAGSLFFDGAGGDQLFIADHADFTPAGDFTFEWWERHGTLVGTQTVFVHATDANNRYIFQANATGVLSFVVKSAGVDIITVASPAGTVTDDASDEELHHIALVRSGSVFTIYKDGISVVRLTSSTAISNFTSLFRIGINQAGTESFIGWIDEFRFSHRARWTANFTPPAAPYQTSGDIVTITRGQLNTVAIAHEAQDRVQQVLSYVGISCADIARDLLVNYAGVDDDFIPIEDWQDEASSSLNRVFTAHIAEPTGVNTLLDELIEEAALSMWWNELARKIRLRVLRAIPADAQTFDRDSYLKGTFKSREQPETRISQIWQYFGKRNPLERHDNADNYRSIAITANPEAETDYGSAVIVKVFARWTPFGGRSIAEKSNELRMSRFVNPPRRFNFSTMRSPHLAAPELGQGYRIGGHGLQDATGAAIAVPIQITRLNPGDAKFDCEAQELLIQAVAPEDLINRVIIIDGNINNIEIREIHDTLYPEPTDQDVLDGVNLKVIVATGVIVGAERAPFGSGNTPSPACDIGTWPSGFPITLIINGKIQGAGGRGGQQATNRNGQAGGVALYTRHAIDIEVGTGMIWGGGGGGGAGGTRFNSGTGVITKGCGGGGGAGVEFGSAGFGSIANGVQAQNGSPGTEFVGGAGGTVDGNDGGSGGNPGSAGSAGQLSGSGATTNPAGSGGAAGAAIDGVSFVTITIGPGDIQGPQVN